MNSASRWFIFIAAATLLWGCGEEKMKNAAVEGNPVTSVPASAWQKLSSKRIYFGHQSVGYNITQGIQDLMADNPAIRLNLIDVKDGRPPEGGGVFGHGTIGKNQQPETKLDDFRKRLDEGANQRIDMAMMKFCYVDVVDDTDIGILFAKYKTRIEEIKARYPGVLIIHSTVPLITDSPSLKTTVKRLLGRGESSCGENKKKNEYNELLLKEYGGTEPIFDLARVESTRMDGTRVTCTKDGKTFFRLNPDFTYDGGHLNAKGRKVVAAHLLALLAELAEKN